MIEHEGSKRLRRCLRGLLRENPFYGTLALGLPLTPDKSRETLACDGERIYFNTKWVMETPADDIRAAVAHVVTACVLNHHTRRGERDYGKWQKASVIATHPILKTDGIVDGDYPAVCGIHPDEELTAEEAYKRIPDSDEDGDGGDTGAGVAPQGQSAGDGEGQGGGGGASGSKDPTGRGEVLDAAKGTDTKEEEQRWDEMAQQARQISKAQGHEPGAFEELLDAAHHKTADWIELFRRFLQATAKKDYSWKRPNRRFISDDLYLPSLHSNEMPPIVFAIDTSGSMSSEELTEALTELRAIAEETCPERVTIIQCDAAIHSVESYEPSEVPSSIEFKGRGGTSFHPVFQYVEEEDINPVCLVYATDMCAGWPEEPLYPVLWLDTAPSLGIEPPWGEHVEVER